MSEYNQHKSKKSIFTRMRRGFALMSTAAILSSVLFSAAPALSVFNTTAYASNHKTVKAKKTGSKEEAKVTAANSKAVSASDSSTRFNNDASTLSQGNTLSSKEMSFFKAYIDKLPLTGKNGVGMSDNQVSRLKKGKVYNSDLDLLNQANKKYISNQSDSSSSGVAGADSKGGSDDASKDPIATVNSQMAASGSGDSLAKKIKTTDLRPGNALALMAKGNSFLGITSQSSYTASYVSLFDAKAAKTIDSYEQDQHGANDSGMLNGIKNTIFGTWDQTVGGISNRDLDSNANSQNQVLGAQAASASYMAALTSLGLIKSSANDSGIQILNNTGRYILGVILIVGNMANTIVNWLFKMVAYLANTVNPIQWMTSGHLSRDNPALASTQPMSPAEAEGTTPTIFQKLGYTFYKMFFYAQKIGMTGAALALGVGLAMGILGWKLSGKIDTSRGGHGIGATIARFFLRSVLILALPLILASLLSSVMTNVAYMYGQHRSSSADYAVYSNMVNFEDWVQGSRLDLPPVVATGSNNSGGTGVALQISNPTYNSGGLLRSGDDTDTSGNMSLQSIAASSPYGGLNNQVINSPYMYNQGVATHNLVLAINAYSAGIPGAKSALADARSASNSLSTSTKGNVGSVTGSQLDAERSQLLSSWFNHNMYSSGNWTSFVKAQLMAKGSQYGSQLTKILSDPKNNYGTNGTLTVQPRMSDGSVVDQPFITGNPEKATSTGPKLSGSTSDNNQESISDPNGGLSTLSIGNALNTSYGPTSLTYTSPNSLQNSFSGVEYYSAVISGTGLTAIGNFFVMIGLIWSTAILGFFFAIQAIQAIVWCIPRLLGYLMATATGSFKAACKSITVVVGLIVELEIGAILYLLFQEMIVSFSQIMNDIVSSTITQGVGFTNSASGSSNAPSVLGSTSSMFSNDASSIMNMIPHIKGATQAFHIAGGTNNAPAIYGIANVLFGIGLVLLAWSLVKVRSRIVNIFTSLSTGFFDALFQVVDNSLGGASAFQANAYTSSMNESPTSMNGPGTDNQSKLMGYGKSALGMDSSGNSPDVNHDDQELADNDVPSTDVGVNGSGAGATPLTPVADGASYGPGGQQTDSSNQYSAGSVGAPGNGQYQMAGLGSNGVYTGTNPDGTRITNGNSQLLNSNGSVIANYPAGYSTGGVSVSGSNSTNPLISGSGYAGIGIGSGVADFGGGKYAYTNGVLANQGTGYNPNIPGDHQIHQNGHKYYGSPAGTMKQRFVGGDGRKALPYNTANGILGYLGGSNKGSIFSNLLQAMGNPNGLGGLMSTFGLSDSTQSAENMNAMMGGSPTNTAEINKLAGMQNIGKLFNYGLGEAVSGLGGYGSINTDAGSAGVDRTPMAPGATGFESNWASLASQQNSGAGLLTDSQYSSNADSYNAAEDAYYSSATNSVNPDVPQWAQTELNPNNPDGRTSAEISGFDPDIATRMGDESFDAGTDAVQPTLDAPSLNDIGQSTPMAQALDAAQDMVSGNDVNDYGAFTPTDLPNTNSNDLPTMDTSVNSNIPSVDTALPNDVPTHDSGVNGVSNSSSSLVTGISNQGVEGYANTAPSMSPTMVAQSAAQGFANPNAMAVNAQQALSSNINERYSALQANPTSQNQALFNNARTQGLNYALSQNLNTVPQSNLITPSQSVQPSGRSYTVNDGLNALKSVKTAQTAITNRTGNMASNVANYQTAVRSAQQMGFNSSIFTNQSTLNSAYNQFQKIPYSYLNGSNTKNPTK